MRTVATIGVFGWTKEAFLDALQEAAVALLIDVRQRRAVRGQDYPWANAVRLKAALAQAGVAYSHHKELAPTTELRQLQYRADAQGGVGKRSRAVLAPEYRETYQREILDHADLGALAEEMPDDRTSAVLCVERNPEACHRSMIAGALARRLGISPLHILP